MTLDNFYFIICAVIKMYEVIFYKDRNGRQPVKEYLDDLLSKSDKTGRIKANKILQYIDALTKHGTAIGESQVKHIDGKIFELRPIDDRIMFAALIEGRFLLLSHFVKKTQKTPQREIELAKRRLKDFEEREKDGR